ncbi:hypothetical protein V2J09_002033 [Rumex salicifolius]
MATPTATPLTTTVLCILLLVIPAAVPTAKAEETLKTETHTFGFPFNQTYYEIFSVEFPATISNNALQVTPDSIGNFSLTNRSGRILYNRPFILWENGSPSAGAATKVASFNTTFLINIFRSNLSATPGEGVAFVIAPDLYTPPGSDGQYLGLTNSTTDGSASNHLFAVEFDTYKQDFDIDENHIGIDINSIRSNKTVSLSALNITLAPNGTVFHKVWIHYNGRNKTLAVYIADQSEQTDMIQMPKSPVLTMDNLDLSTIVEKESFFGFSAATGAEAEELHCVLSWNMTVEIIADRGGGKIMPIAIGVAAAAAAALLAGAAIGWLCWRRKANRSADRNILGALKSLPGMPREFEFRDLKKATRNFDEKNKLGQGGYGVVYRGVLPLENVEVAVKKFTREDNIKSTDDFLCELTIINRLRHRHLVKLLGWCHKNGMLLLVYEYMPNGSLDKHIFCNEDQTPITWNLRYKILKGVASALHYLHYEYDSTVIHRDLKPSNIMLDTHFNTRLGDFGLARALDQEKTSYAEMEGIHGTMGYIAPECFHTGKATRESDVYAFGAVLLEVACGARPWARLGGFGCLVDWVWSLHRDGSVIEAVDRRMGEDEVVGDEVKRVLLLGLACMHPMRCERPKTHDIVQILSGSVPGPDVPLSKPTFVWPAFGPVCEEDLSLDMSMTNETEWTPRSYNQESFDGCTDHSTVHSTIVRSGFGDYLSYASHSEPLGFPAYKIEDFTTMEVVQTTESSELFIGDRRIEARMHARKLKRLNTGFSTYGSNVS